MKKLIALSAVMAAALLVLSGQAMARGGSSAGGKGMGTGSGGNKMSVSRPCEETGNCGETNRTHVRVKDQKQNQKQTQNKNQNQDQNRHMNTNRTKQQAPKETTPSTN